jgi:hypothetical protein
VLRINHGLGHESFFHGSSHGKVFIKLKKIEMAATSYPRSWPWQICHGLSRDK